MDDTLRVGHVERDVTTSLLAEHYAAGRLTKDELDERSTAALQARTRADLTALTADLPPTRPRAVVNRADPAAVQRKAHLLWTRTGLAPWALFAVVFVVIWAATGMGYFWPIWPIMGWGIAVASGGVLAHTLPQVFLERQAQREGCGLPMR